MPNQEDGLLARIVRKPIRCHIGLHKGNVKPVGDGKVGLHCTRCGDVIGAHEVDLDI